MSRRKKININSIAIYVLIAIVTVAAVTDILKGKVYNWLTFPAIVIGLGINVFQNSWHGFFNGLSGFILGFLAFFIFYLMGGIGGGDVKLMGAVGAFGGLQFTLSAIYYVAICGAFLALLYMGWYGTFFSTFGKLGRVCLSFFVPGMKASAELVTSTTRKLPYGVAIAAGTILTIFIPMEFI